MGRLVTLLLALALLVSLPVEGHAQGEMEELTVSLLPQYDDPRLFIVYEAYLSEPGEVSLGVPPGVELHRALYRTDAGEYEEVEGRFVALHNGRVIRFTSPTRSVRLELYQDVIPRQPQRFVDFTLPAQPQDVAQLRWVAVYPPDATDLRMAPPMESQGQNHLGMPLFVREAGPLPAGESDLQTIEWTRESDRPMIDLPAEESADASGASERQRLAYLGAGGLFLVGLALVFHGVWKQRRRTVAG